MLYEVITGLGRNVKDHAVDMGHLIDDALAALFKGPEPKPTVPETAAKPATTERRDNRQRRRDSSRAETGRRERDKPARGETQAEETQTATKPRNNFV